MNKLMTHPMTGRQRIYFSPQCRAEFVVVKAVGARKKIYKKKREKEW